MPLSYWKELRAIAILKEQRKVLWTVGHRLDCYDSVASNC